MLKENDSIVICKDPDAAKQRRGHQDRRVTREQEVQGKDTQTIPININSQ